MRLDALQPRNVEKITLMRVSFKETAHISGALLASWAMLSWDRGADGIRVTLDSSWATAA
jgi:hypothetical protein